MKWFLVILIGYLLGCSNMAVYLAKAKKVDLKKGSGNPGTSNTLILMGKKCAVLVGIHDIGKAVVAVVIARLLLPGYENEFAWALAGISCVIGHMYPFYMRFRGGKGFAPYIGLMLGFDWKAAIVIIILTVAISFVADYIVAGTLTTVISFPLYLAMTSEFRVTLLVTLLSGLIIYKHRKNLIRIYSLTEFKLRDQINKDK